MSPALPSKATATTGGSLGPWLRTVRPTDARAQRVLDLGLLTGLKHDARRGYHLANFERGLVLDRLVELRRPRRVLEVGTGRGLGCLALAAAGQAHGAPLHVTTIDLQGPREQQAWPVEVKGERTTLQASRDEVWRAHVPDGLAAAVRQETGRSSEVLPRLHRAGERFDLAFIDAGHDLHSVVHDLAYATTMLAPGGAILMDDYAPMEDFGVGTCIAVAHARRLFERVEVFPTDGVVYGREGDDIAARGMALLTGLRGTPRFSRAKLTFWRVAASVLHRAYDPRRFPLEVA